KESLELSLIELATQEFNFVQVRVAPRPYVGISSWQIAKDLLRGRSINLEAIDEHEIRPDRLSVRRIAAARIDGSARLSFLALVEGRVENDVPLEFPIRTRATEIGHVSVTVRQDEYLARILPIPSTTIAGASCPGQELEIEDPTQTIPRTPVRCLP